MKSPLIASILFFSLVSTSVSFANTPENIECKTSFNGEESVQKKSLESFFAQESGNFDFRGSTVWNFAVGSKTFSVNYVVNSEFENYILLAIASADTASLDPASPNGMGPNMTVVTSGSGSFDRSNLVPSKTQVVQSFVEIKAPPDAVITIVSCEIK